MKSNEPTEYRPGELVEEGKYFYNEDHGLPVIMSLFHGYLGRDVLEIGSGTGAIADFLVNAGCHVTAVEPEPILIKKIRARFPSGANVEVIESDSTSAYAQLIESDRTFDTVIYVSVLEHIADDLHEFVLAKGALRPGGRLLVFVPALPALYSQIDANTGHIRRYTKQRFRELTKSAGLELVSLRYFETVGIIPYLIVYKLLRRRVITSSSTSIYNNVILPLSMFLYRITRGHLIGKNLVLVARKL